jgi:hypothetical protein
MQHEGATMKLNIPSQKTKPRPSWSGLALLNGPAIFARLQRAGLGQTFDVMIAGMIRAEGLSLVNAREFAMTCLMHGIPDRAPLAHRPSRERPKQVYESSLDAWIKKAA